jgi:hypothetical protein
MAQDSKGELFFLTDSGVYMISSSSTCDSNKLSSNDPTSNDQEIALYISMPIVGCIVIVTAYALYERRLKKKQTSSEEIGTNPQNVQENRQN